MQKQQVLVIVAVAVFALAVYQAVAYFGDDGLPDRVENQWFYDLNSKGLYPAPLSVVAAHDAPSGALSDQALAPGTEGKAGVKAMVYSCGACAEDEQYIGYLTYMADAVKGFTELEQETEKAANTFIRRESDSEWVTFNSEESMKIQLEARGKCGKNKPKTCVPRK